MLPVGTRVVITTDRYKDSKPRSQGATGTIYRREDGSLFTYLVKLDEPVGWAQGGFDTAVGFYANDEWIAPIQNNLKREDFL